jgi:DNA-binding FadR family transcriptional regulator
MRLGADAVATFGEADQRLARLLAVIEPGGLLSINEQIAEGLRRAITLGLFPDNRLPAERKLAQLLGVSRITVRQSLDRLKRDGFVTTHKGRAGGNYATPLSRRPESTWTTILDSAHRDIGEIQSFRSMLEPVAAQLAAERGTAEAGVRLRTAVQALATSTTPDEFRRADSDFHITVAEAAGNSRLLAAVVQARAELLVWRDLLPMPDDVELNAAEHNAIAEAIVAGNSAECYALMREHLESARQSFWREVERYRKVQGQPAMAVEGSVT